MSCYMRHLTSLFDTLGLVYDKSNRTRVDSAIRTVLSVPDEARCPEVWSALKALPPEDDEALPSRIAEILQES